MNKNERTAREARKERWCRAIRGLPIQYRTRFWSKYEDDKPSGELQKLVMDLWAEHRRRLVVLVKEASE